MSGLLAFRNRDGSVGIRRHGLVLPVVVCANQVAIDVAQAQPGLKFIEHQHGCAQIGQDLTQTRQVFAQMAAHPNVTATAFVSLGCEAILAAELMRETAARGQPQVELFVIQQLGGTHATADEVTAWLNAAMANPAAQTRSAAAWDELLVGIMMDDDDPPLAALAALVQALAARGARLILPLDQRDRLAPGLACGEVPYATSTSDRCSAMAGGSNGLEVATGLVAAGAHLIVHVATQPHGFGNPLAPIVRLAASETLHRSCPDDFDGMLRQAADAPAVLARMEQVVCGLPTVSEEVGLDDFALYRIGPTV